MLKIVCIKITAVYYQIRLYIIVKYGNLQIIPLFRQKRLCLLQNLCMGRRAGSYRDCLQIS